MAPPEGTSESDRRTVLAERLRSQMAGGYWPGYVHSYPHKRAYRPLVSMDMRATWAGVTDLNLYVHVPFCERKCSFCNLFSYPVPTHEMRHVLDAYVDAVVRQIEYYREYIPAPRVTSLFYGGGTPNVLASDQLARIQEALTEAFGTREEDVEECIECSPDRLSPEYIRELRRLGFDRVSIGVQSFFQEDLDHVNRHYSAKDVYEVIQNLRSAGLRMNLDLIYGLPGQSESSIMRNLDQVAELGPECITIYPLAVRELTGIGRLPQSSLMSTRDKYALYDRVRMRLEEAGYTCQTVVRYVKSDSSTYQQQRLEYAGVPTLGLGAGARSYAPSVHYCLPYRVQSGLVSGIVRDFLKSDFGSAQHTGFLLGPDELRRKHLTLSLLDPGISIGSYERVFGASFDFVAELGALMDAGLVESQDGDFYALTRMGRKYSDVAAGVFQSERVTELYSAYRPE
jgi:oxygen-independent coproporphyrinogen-3 oxidase